MRVKSSRGARMFLRIAGGSGLLIANILIAAVAAMLLEVFFLRSHGWLLREPHRPKLVLLLTGVSIWVLGVITAGVWGWGGGVHQVGGGAASPQAGAAADRGFDLGAGGDYGGRLGLGDCAASVGGVSDAGRGGLFLVGGLYDAGSGRSGACLPVAAAGGDGGGQRAADLWPADRAVDRGAAADPSGAGRAYPQPQPCGRLDRRSGRAALLRQDGDAAGYDDGAAQQGGGVGTLAEHHHPHHHGVEQPRIAEGGDG